MGNESGLGPTSPLHELNRRVVKALRLLRRFGWTKALLRHGVAATVEHSALPLDHASTVIDVGANKGQFALFARAKFPEATIHCFEPLSEPRSKLELVFHRDPVVHVYPVAIGREKTLGEINVSWDDDSSSLLRPSRIQTSRWPTTEVSRRQTIQVTTLDEALSNVTLASPRR